MMTLKLRSLFVLVALSAISVSAQAESYIGVKAGSMMIDLDGFDDPLNAGIVFGTSDTGFSFEGEVTTTLSDGEVFGADVGLTTLAGYASYRSDGDVYFKGKAGVLYEDVEIGSVSDDDTGASYGLGLGWRLGGGNMLEVEYTIIEEDVDFLSVGMSF